MIKTSLYILALVALVACGGGSGSSGGGSSIPNDLNPEMRVAMTTETAISTQSKAKIAEIIKTHSSMLPSANMIFDDYKNAEKRAKDLKKLNSSGEELLQEIQLNCQLKPGAESRSGEARVGSTVVMEKESSIAGGNNCPVSYNKKVQTSTSIQSFDDRALTGSMKIEEVSTTNLIGENLQKKINYKSSSVQMSLNAKMEKVKMDAQNNVLSGAMHSYGTGDLALVKGDNTRVLGKVQFESIQRPSSKKTQVLVTFDFPEGDIAIGAIAIDKKIEFFVNGTPYTADEIMEEFGMDMAEFEIL